MAHSISFGDGTLYDSSASDHKCAQFKPTIGNTYEDWFLIPSSRPSVAVPSPAFKYVSIPGRDGELDLSGWLRRDDRPSYGNRTGSFEFYVENDHEDWTTIRTRIANALNGKKCRMVLEDDPAYYYEGRFSVTEWASEANWSKVTIGYTLSPWKMRIRSALELPVWDTFNFEKDYDYYPWGLDAITVDGSKEFTIYGEGFPFQLVVRCVSGGSVIVTFGGETKTIAVGEKVSIGHALHGQNIISITTASTAVIRMDWRGGSL